MSMLAERKRKAKWIIHSSKKPLWDTDSEGIKFGKGLMEKMGWSAGKGLGVNEQGITEPLKVSHKVDTKGVGYKGNEESWTKQQDEFDSLLSQLSNSVKSNKNSDEFSKTDVKSLEEKSKKSRARVHYQKFTRGKDLSRYNEKDLACILGTSKLIKPNDNKEKEKEPETDKTDNNNENNFGFKTINSGSLEDYFKKKWLDKKKNKNIDNSQNNMQYCVGGFDQEGLNNVNFLQNYNNLGTENQETLEPSESIGKSSCPLPEIMSVEEKNLEKHLSKKKKRKSQREEFPEKIKKSKKNKSERDHSKKFSETNKVISSLEKIRNTESDNDSSKIRSENLLNDDCEINKENIKKKEKLKKQKHKGTEINFKHGKGPCELNASEPTHYSDNNLEEKRVKKKKKDKQKSKEKTDLKAEEGKNKENKKSKKYAKFGADTNEKISESETPKSKPSKESKKENKKILELENICDNNELNLECNAEEKSNGRKHKKTKKKRTEKKIKNEKGHEDLNDVKIKNKNSNLNTVTKGVLENHKEHERSDINKKVEISNEEHLGKTKAFDGKTNFKEILEKNENEPNNEDCNFTAAQPPNKNVMYSVHTKKKKLNYNKVIKLTYGASIDKFVGSNLLGLPGYGTISRNKNVNAKAT